MKRRDFLKVAAMGAAAWPLAGRAQPGAMPTIGFLRVTSAADSAHLVAGFEQGLKESGFIAGRNIAIEYRFAESHRDRLPALAADLVARNVRMILTDQAVHDVKAATSTIPIVFVLGADPVAVGIVDSMNRPGKNVTGVVFFSSQLGSKRLGLLHQLAPSAKTFGMLAYPANVEDRTERGHVEAAARDAGTPLIIADAVTDGEIEQAFASLAQKGVGAVIVGSGPFFRSRQKKIVDLAAQHRLPACYSLREYAESGGLMSYGTSITNAYREAGIYAAQLVRGANAGELPVKQSTKFELVVNLKTARTLGLAVPQDLLVAADDVIE